jgi:beta-hydroxylase
MIGILVSVGAAVTFVASMAYVYRFRGEVRYASAREYLKHTWPIFAPINCFLYMFTQNRGKGPILELEKFSELALIQENWETIRDEAIELWRARCFESINEPGQAAHYDVGFRTFFRHGWRKYYLTWYGYTHQSAIESCPKTISILSKIPSVRGAMLAILPAGGKLTRHIDPLGCSVRYHLGLVTPNSDDCYINVDGNFYSWRDSEAFLFDMTYAHFANNDSDQDRIILMCDVERPTFFLGKLFNWLLLKLMPVTIVPNTEQDRAGIANKIFRMSVPITNWFKNLKKRNRTLYKILKYALNIFLLATLLGILIATVSAISWLGNYFINVAV